MAWNDGSLNPAAASNASARQCTVPMGITSENVAARWNIGRGAQDAVAVRSHARAAHARMSGLFDAEIVPVFATDSANISTNISEDEGIREGVSLVGRCSLNPGKSG